MPRSNIIPFGRPVDYEERPRFVDERINLHDSFMAMPQAARAAAASRWSLLRVSSTASIAIAVGAALYFAGQLLRAVLS